MSTVAIIQARMGSERLPGKVLMNLGGYPILEWVTTRVKHSAHVNQVVLATTQCSKDDPIVDACNNLGVAVHRGSENNVLNRFFEAALEYNATTVVRICCDCPFIDPIIIDVMLEKYFETNQTSNLDYLSNTLERTFPRGLDLEIFSFSALEFANLHAKRKDDFEHVTPFIYRNPKLFSIAQYKNDIINEHLRWTLDTGEDYIFIQSLVKALNPKNILSVSTEQLLQCIEKNPNLTNINSHIKQKEISVNFF